MVSAATEAVADSSCWIEETLNYSRLSHWFAHPINFPKCKYIYTHIYIYIYLKKKCSMNVHVLWLYTCLNTRDLMIVLVELPPRFPQSPPALAPQQRGRAGRLPAMSWRSWRSCIWWAFWPTQLRGYKPTILGISQGITTNLRVGCIW